MKPLLSSIEKSPEIVRAEKVQNVDQAKPCDHAHKKGHAVDFLHGELV